MTKKKNVKTYAQKITQKKRKSLLEEVSRAIKQHERFRNAYFFEPPYNASGRRHYEKINSIKLNFVYDGHLYEYASFVSCSCKNVYYDHFFAIDEYAVNVKPFKKVQRELTEAIEAYDLKHSNKEQ